MSISQNPYKSDHRQFMQRAAASPNSSSPSTPSQPPSKKQRLSSGGATPATPSSDARAIQEALAAEELKRQQALDRQAADAGETKWVLSYQEVKAKTREAPMRIVTAGYGSIDSAAAVRAMRANIDSDSEDEGSAARKIQGRRSFGRFNRAVEVRLNFPPFALHTADT